MSCTVCSSGWVTVTYADPDSVALYGELRNREIAVACLCAKGRVKKAKGVEHFLDEDQLLELFDGSLPDGFESSIERVKLAGIPDAWHGWSLRTYTAKFGDDPSLRPFIEQAKKWIDGPTRSDIVLYGSNGTGKTGLAVALVRALAQRRESVKFWTVRELAMEWRSTYGAEALRSERDLLSELLAPRLVVLDEVGGTKLTDFVEDTLTMIVDLRQKQMFPTVLTMNLPEENPGALSDEVLLARMLGPTLFDRLRQRAQFWPMRGASRRETMREA